MQKLVRERSRIGGKKLDNWTFIQYIQAMERSKTLRMELPATRCRPEPVEAGWVTLVRWVLAFLVAVLASVVSVPADARAVQADTVVSGRMVGVSDGDTVTLLTDDLVQHKVRLRGIDAPEKAQAFGNRAKQALSALVFGRRVSLAYSKVDRYGRWVGRITVGDGEAAVDVSRALIEQGMAWHYTAYEREQAVEERDGDREAELRARAERRGLWGDREPVAPWDFRHSGRTQEPKRLK